MNQSIPLMLRGALMALACVTASCRAHNNLTSELGVTDPQLRDFDVGIYWYGPNKASLRFVKGQPNPYFDKHKPTVIFTHGWTRGFELRRETRRDFLYINPATKNTIYTAQAWLDLGWNVGEFEWDQLADEDLVYDAEAKIWATNGDKGMRWRREDGTFTEDGSPTVSVSDLYYKAYTEAMADYEGDNIRLVGHSLGTQLTANLVGQLYDDAQAKKIDPKLVPKRAALLDPFWMQKDPAITWPGRRVRQIVQKTKGKGIAWEMIKTSGVLQVPVLGPLLVDRNEELTDLIGELVFRPDFENRLSPVDTITNRHRVAIAIYLLSMSTRDASVATLFGTQGPTLAGASDEQVLKFMNHAKSYRQTSAMANIFDLAIPLQMYDDPFKDPTAVSTTVDNEMPGAVTDDPSVQHDPVSSISADSPDASQSTNSTNDADGTGDSQERRDRNDGRR